MILIDTLHINNSGGKILLEYLIENLLELNKNEDFIFIIDERLETKLEQYPGQLTRACVELAKDWRTDKYLRKLEAMMIVVDKNTSLILTGSGDVLEPEDGIIGIGSGGNFALSAARALIDIPDLSVEDILKKSMKIAGDLCVYTNHNVIIETL